MSTLNKFTLIGHLGNDPVLERTKNGRPYCKISIATDGYAVENGPRKPFWHQVHVFGRQAETLAEYGRKGRHMLIEGRFEPNSTTESDGKVVWRVFLTADRATFLNSASEGKAVIPSFEEELARLDDSTSSAQSPTA